MARLGLFLELYKSIRRSYITSRNSPRTLIMSFISNLLIIYLCSPQKRPSLFSIINPIKTLFRMTQSSNLGVFIVEHVYRMIALLLYITSRNSPRWPRLMLFLEVILTQNSHYHEVYVHIKQIICLRI